MKKMTAILLTMSLVLGLTACGSTGAASSTAAESAQTEAAANSAGEEAEPAAEPAGAETAEPAGAETAESAGSETAESAGTEAAEPAEDEAAMSDETVNPAGGYKLTNLTTQTGSNLEVISTVVDMGVKYYIILEEDGTGKMSFLEAEIPLTWNESSLMVEPGIQGQNAGTLKLPYTYADGLLKIDTQAYSMEFTSLTEAEFEDYRLNGTGSLPGMLKQAITPLLGNLDDLASTLYFLLAAGEEREPIPEDEPSEGIVNGRLGDLEISIVGTAHIKGDEDKDLLVIYFDVTNHSETEVISTWGQLEIDTMQDGEWLDEVYDYDRVPEIQNYDFGIAPGMTLRCADSYHFNPKGGVTGFRFTSMYADNSILYYADPANPAAPEESFVIGANSWNASFLDGVPEENEELRIESMRFFTDQDGQDVVEIYFHFVNTSGADGVPLFENHGCYALQDGIGLRIHYGENPPEEQSNASKEAAAGEDVLIYRAYIVRSDSPVTFVVCDDSTGQSIPEIAKTIEVAK